MANPKSDAITRARVEAGRCPHTECEIPLEGHPRCTECGALVGKAHISTSLKNGVCNRCREFEYRLRN
jgi:hypothetical protein